MVEERSGENGKGKVELDKMRKGVRMKDKRKTGN